MKTPQVPALPGMSPLGMKPEPATTPSLQSRIAALERVAEAASEILAEFDTEKERAWDEDNTLLVETGGIALARSALSALDSDPEEGGS